MSKILLCAVFGFTHEIPVYTDTVDLIELNHYYDEQGKHILDQVIFWEWREEESTYRVLAWRFFKPIHPFPSRDPDRGVYVFVWYDAERLRHVRSLDFRETWTQYDPEVADRAFVAQAMRRGLIRHCRAPRLTRRIP